jgi:hypothetical protein
VEHRLHSVRYFLSLSLCVYVWAACGRMHQVSLSLTCSQFRNALRLRPLHVSYVLSTFTSHWNACVILMSRAASQDKEKQFRETCENIANFEGSYCCLCARVRGDSDTQ